MNETVHRAANDAASNAAGNAASADAGAAAQRLAHSRERIRRYLVRSAAADPQQQQAARTRRHMWLGAALAVAVLLAWQRPWRRASGLARGLALVMAGLKVPGMLHTLAGSMEGLMGWWHTFAQARTAASATWRSDGPAETREHTAPAGDATQGHGSTTPHAESPGVQPSPLAHGP